MARTIVGEAYIQILPTDGGVSPGVQRIIDNLPNQVEVPVTAETEQATAAVAQLSGQIESQLGGAWQAAAVQAAAFTASVLGIRAAIEGAVGQLAGLFDQLRQAQAGFTAILGSEAAGTRLLDDIREFARVSPFVTAELVNYSQQLLGVGQSAESIVPLLQRTGDLIASVGGDTQNISRVLFTLTQIRSIGRLVGQDAIQLQSALIPITKLLADSLGKTTAEIKKMQEQGSISADTVFQALIDAGEKVEGAMDNATRNITGARSVLQDTVEIMFQNSQVLNRVNDDIVQGILGFADALGENEQLTDLIERMDEAFLGLYESIQPLLEGLSSTSSALALNSLSILATSLEVLATAINAIPPGALELIGRGLAIMFALRAPLALISYVQNLSKLSDVLRNEFVTRHQALAGDVERTGAAAQVATTRLQAASAAVQAHARSIGFASLAAGLFVSAIADENEALQNLGGTLSGAGLGAQLGAAFGPQGALIGLAAGAGIGFVTSFVGNAREEAERRQAEMEGVAERAAKSFSDAFRLSYGDIDTSADFEAFFDRVSELQPPIDELDETLARVEAIQNVIDEVADSPNAYAAGADTALAALQESLQAGNDLLDQQKNAAEQARLSIEAIFDEEIFRNAADTLATRLGELRRDSEEWVALVERVTLANRPEGPEWRGFDRDVSDDILRAVDAAVLLGERSISSADDLNLFQQVAEETGISLNAFLTLPLETLVEMMSVDVPSALTRTRVELQATQTAFDEAKKSTEEFFKPFAQQVNAAQQALQAEQGLSKAAQQFVTDQTESNALALGEAYLKVLQNIATANEAVFEGTGTSAGISFLVAELDRLREQLDLTDVEFEQLLTNMGLLSLYRTGVDAGFTGTITELAERTGLTVNRLKEISPTLRQLEAGKEFTIPLNILGKLQELDLLDERFRQMPDTTREVVESLEADFLQIDLTGGLVTQIDTAVEQLNRLRDVSAGVFLDMISLINEMNAAGLDSIAVGANETFLDIEARRANQERTNPNFGQQLQRQQIEAELDQLRRQQARDAEAERARLEAERLAREAEAEANRLLREQEAAQREAERLAREQERLIEEQLREQERLRDALRDSSETIQTSMETASQNIRDAAENLTQSLRERVRDEEAVSVSRLIRNAADQANRLTELDQGLVQLRSRGLSDEAISGLGIDNITDIRQLRRLLGASGSDLAELNRLISLRDSNAEAIARRERQQETQATIVAAIIQAATILGYEVTPEAARQISLMVNVTGDPASAVLPTGIIEQIQNAGVLLRT